MRGIQMKYVVFVLFVLLVVSGEVFAEGCVSGNCSNGNATYVDSYGTYTGDWKDGKRHGKGTKVYYTGGSYTGDWQYDHQTGYGTDMYPDGSKYTGNYKKDKRHGKGTFEYSDGSKYTGDFQNNMYHGYGTKVYTDGSYTGDWKENERTGYGTFVDRNGVTYTGGWQNDKMHGEGIVTLLNGKKLSIVYDMGVGKVRNEIIEQPVAKEPAVQSSQPKQKVATPSGHKWKKPVQ